MTRDGGKALSSARFRLTVGRWMSLADKAQTLIFEELRFVAAQCPEALELHKRHFMPRQLQRLLALSARPRSRLSHPHRADRIPRWQKRPG